MGLLTKKVGRVLKSTFFELTGIFLRKMFFFCKIQFYKIFLVFEHKSSHFGKTFSPGLSKLHSTCPHGFLRSFLRTSKVKLFLDFQTFKTKNFQTFGRNISVGLSKLLSTSSKENFEEVFSWKPFFSDVEQLFFGSLAKK